MHLSENKDSDRGGLKRKPRSDALERDHISEPKRQMARYLEGGKHYMYMKKIGEEFLLPLLTHYSTLQCSESFSRVFDSYRILENSREGNAYVVPSTTIPGHFDSLTKVCFIIHLHIIKFIIICILVPEKRKECGRTSTPALRTCRPVHVVHETAGEEGYDICA